MATKSKNKPKRKSKKAKGDDFKVDAQVVAQNTQDPEYARAIIKAVENWETVREFGVKERKRTKELVDARLASLKEAMELGHNTESDQLLKLSAVESRWQELEEARDERREISSACRDQLKNAHQQIRDLLSPQLGLFSGPPNTDPSTYESTSTIDNPPEPEEDEDTDGDDD